MTTPQLHGSWLAEQRDHPARFALWAELLPGRVPSRRRRSAVQRGLMSHPFIAPAAALAALSDIPAGGGSATIIVRLPAADGLPLPSDEPDAASVSTIELLSYRVPALLLDAPAAIRFLVSVAATAPPPDARPGEDLRFWALAARLALDLLAAQQFRPDLVLPAARSYRAAWQPVLARPEDRERLERLAASMPAACRALAREAADPEPGAHPLLESFLGSATDGLAREALAAAATLAWAEAGSQAKERAAGAWLAALQGEPELHGDQRDLARLYDEFQTWRGGEVGIDQDSFRVCFRLDPPSQAGEGPEAAGDRRWTLEFLLQANDDPSLLVPAGDVWRSRTTTGKFLDRRFDHPHERLLTALGRASRLFPPIERSLETSRPEYCSLSVSEAYGFVRESALLLQDSGYGVLVPGLQSKLGLRLKLGSRSASKQSSGPSVLGWDSLVDYDWQLAIGDQSLSRQEFEALARLKEPLVQLRGQWIELRPEQLQQALALFRQADSRGEMSLQDALRVALAPDGELGLPVVEVQTEGWIDELLDQLREASGREVVDAPPGFVGRLRPYQQVGVSWLATLSHYGLGACLADDMGLGKTVQIIALLLHQKQLHGTQPTLPTLLICPTSVVGNWIHELGRFAPDLRALVHHGAERTRDGLAAEAGKADVVISTYALLHRDQAELSQIEWANVVLDEAQNIKNPSTRAAQSARSLRCRWRVALTGTPIENRLSDLWSLFQFLAPGYLGSNDEFRRRFATPIERGGDSRASARLKALIAPLLLRRLKTDRTIIEDLPEKNEMKVFCTITPEQATLYEAIVRDSVRIVEEAADGIRRRGLILAMIAKLKQVCDHPVLFLKDGGALAGRSGKLARLEEMLEEVVAAGDRALVFSQFAEMGGLLKAHLQRTLGQEVLFLHGGTPARDRDRMVRRFQSEGSGPQVFILSIKAGGTGLNLTRANHVFHFDRWWNPAVENQATDRAFRIGQRRDVEVHKFICAGTFEQTIDELIERKVALSQAVIGTNENWITEMSTDQLRDLLALRADAVQG